jgi:hypothetical protein
MKITPQERAAFAWFEGQLQASGTTPRDIPRLLIQRAFGLMKIGPNYHEELLDAYKFLGDAVADEFPDTDVA